VSATAWACAGTSIRTTVQCAATSLAEFLLSYWRLRAILSPRRARIEGGTTEGITRAWQASVHLMCRPAGWPGALSVPRLGVGDWKMRPASSCLHCIFIPALSALSSLWEAPLAVIVQNDSQVNFCVGKVAVTALEN